ncbi:GATA transcription factor 18-like protein [Trifolium pratense]|nr:GATA transcription factor 18-like protein [Trifolium pratense]
MLFSNYQQQQQQQYHDDHYDNHYDAYSYSTPSSSVDCTLSLATPSTRLSEDQDKQNRRSSSITNFFWNKNPSKSKQNSQSQNKNRGNNIGNNSNNDSLLARRCASCDTTSTPLWRNGPRGPKSLCNACGIRYKKEERRANAANVNATSAVTASGVIESGQVYSNNSWYAHQQNQMYGNELRFMDDSDAESENGIPNFLSWRLNTSLVHDYTR